MTRSGSRLDLAHPGWWIFGPAAFWLLIAAAGVGWGTQRRLGLAQDPGERRTWAAAGVAQSSSCGGCHPREYASWHRTFHRTMTQSVETGEVLAPFAGETIEVLGFRATMDRDERHRPRMRIESRDPARARPFVFEASVERMVGSHRVQQYVARIDRGGGSEDRWRLPLAWHVEEARWIHLSGAFLLPQGVDGVPEEYFRHLSRWNDNCLFCHNTEVNPGRAHDGTFATHVGELGIACEACHGPAAAHVERQRPPLHRVLGAWVEAPDTTITPGADLPERRAMEICGRCHGNRIAADLGAVLAHGDPFLPGSTLRPDSRPIERDSTLAGTEGTPFAERFWSDGTPRLSAYEYQALAMSPCHQEGGLECDGCHTMHGDDPVMQLRPDVAGVCQSCHAPAALSEGHRSPSHAGVDCRDCHMPRRTYGLMEGMMSHRIAVPDPAAAIGHGDPPDACTLCHLERSRGWAAEAMAGLGFASPAPHDATPAPEEAWASRVELDLRGGDPISRAIAVHALARPDAVGSLTWRRQCLVDALDDTYPAIRWMAWRGLRRLPSDSAAEPWLREPPSYDVVARGEVIRLLREHWGVAPLHADPDRIEALADARDDRSIEIGE